MKKPYLLLPSILLFALGQVLASAPGHPFLAAAANGNLSTASAGFEENKGQVLTTDGDPAPFVRFVLSSGNAKIFLLENGIAYQFERMHYPEGHSELMADMHSAMLEHEQMEAMHAQVQRETFRMDMLLEGADPQPRISTEGRSLDYTNYYNRDVLNVHHYSKITYHDVYPGIDWIIYTTATGMKYDFVVHPGADPDLIRLRFDHQEELYLDATGNLIHGNRLGRFTEMRPVSFQGDVEVPGAFILEGNILRFGIGDHDPTRTLTIDPDRIWATYYGGMGHDQLGDCATDGHDNIYLAGSTNSTTAIASAGHQVTLTGVGLDAFLVKFNGIGIRQWATYYGGAQTEFGISCAVDGNDHVYLAGFTNSVDAISFQGHQNTPGGWSDAFLVKFNSGGVRQWGTYYGGPGPDSAYDCFVDDNDNVFLAGQTSSSTAIASGGHQNTYGGGSNDAFLVKFNSNGLLQWGTYYGGSVRDIGNSCAVDLDGNVYLAGITTSDSDISFQGHQEVYGGGEESTSIGDAFLVKFNASGVRQWATYYGGTEDDGFQANCAVDDEGNVHLAGSTRSTTAIASAGHQNSYGGGLFDGFLVKFSGSGTRIWGTYYGGADSDEIIFVFAKNGDIYLGGATSSPADIASGGFQNIYGGDKDGFLAKMNSDGVRQWATYYGGLNHDYTSACAIDGNGDIYLGGTTVSTLDIAYNGHQNNYGGGVWDGFLVKFEGNLSTGIFNTAETPVAGAIHLYPNPARNGWFRLTLSDPAFTGSTPVMIELYDAQGKRVHTEHATASGGELSHVLQLGRDHGVGLYSVVVSFGEVRVQRSLVIE